MQLALLEFAEKFVFDNRINITPSQLCKLLDALEKKFTSHNSAMDAIAEQYIMENMLDTNLQNTIRAFVWYVQQRHQ